MYTIRDIKKLGRDFGVPVDYIISNSAQDIGNLANTAYNCAQQWSLDGLVKFTVFNRNIYAGVCVSI